MNYGVTLHPRRGIQGGGPEQESFLGGGDGSGHRLIAMAMIAVAQFALVGYLIARAVAASEVGAIGTPLNAFYYLFGRFEQPHLLLLILFATTGALLVSRGRGLRSESLFRRPISSWGIWIVAALVVLAGVIGHAALLHGYPLSMDEFAAEWQAQLFASGKMQAQVPPAWRSVANLVTPTFITYNPRLNSWIAGYLPVYALMRAAFLKVGLAPLLNPLLSGLSIPLIAMIARRRWPERPMCSWLAVLLLACSTQVLATSMTSYAMPAHLMLNLLWLAMLLRADLKDGRWAILLLPWIGVVAMGLHNPFPHALFAAPFLWRLARTRGLRTALYLAGIYALGAVVWFTWLRYASSYGSATRLASLFGLPDGPALLIQTMALSLLLSWQTPILALGLLLGASRWRQMDDFQRDLMIGVLLTAVFYSFFKGAQGHGWGNRYMYAVLGNVVLVAVLGIDWMAKVIGSRRTEILVVLSLLLTFGVQMPLRARELDLFSEPFAQGYRYLRQRNAAIVAVPASETWYGRDLIRNSPFLTAPVMIALPQGEPSEALRERIRALSGGSVAWIRPQELVALGMARMSAAP